VVCAGYAPPHCAQGPGQVGQVGQVLRDRKDVFATGYSDAQKPPYLPPRRERLKCLTRGFYCSSPAMTLLHRRRCRYHRTMTRNKNDNFVHAPGQLMGLMELSQFLVGHTNNNGYTHRIAAKATFPKPYAELHAARIWLKDDVAAWAREHRPQAPGLKDLD